MKLNEAIDKYLDWKLSYAPVAAKAYEVHLRRFNAFVGNIDISSVQMGDITAFKNSLLTKYSDTSISYMMVIMRNFFEYWNGQGIACLNYKFIRSPKYTQQPHRAITDAEYLLIDQSIPTNTFTALTKKLIVRFLWDTGVRVSELCDIDLGDLDVQNRNAKIITKKTHVVRWVFWTDKTHDILVRYLGIRLCMNRGDALLLAETPNARTRITPRTVQRWISELCKNVGITQKISPHSFRHAKAHKILKQGGSVADIAKILGHSDKNPVAAFNYLRLSKSEIEDRAKLYL